MKTDSPERLFVTENRVYNNEFSIGSVVYATNKIENPEVSPLAHAMLDQQIKQIQKNRIKRNIQQIAIWIAVLTLLAIPFIIQYGKRKNNE